MLSWRPLDGIAEAYESIDLLRQIDAAAISAWLRSDLADTAGFRALSNGFNEAECSGDSS